MEVTFYLLPLAASNVIDKMARFAQDACPEAVIKVFEGYTAFATFGFVEKNKVQGKALLTNSTFTDHLAALSRHPYVELTSAVIQFANSHGDLNLSYGSDQYGKTLRSHLINGRAPKCLLYEGSVLYSNHGWI